jgi:tetratricopeptide (TPR) repeat protein
MHLKIAIGWLLLAAASAAGPAAGQEPARPPGQERTGPGADAKAEAPRPPSTIDELFERLAKADDEAEAKGIAGLIERRWARSGSDTADLLMKRATDAAGAKDFPLAIELLDRVLVLEPQWTEAWYRRANVFFLMDDPVDAMADLKQVITREPRHYAAWTGLGHIYMNSDDKRRALEAYRKALSIHPKQSSVETLVERLKPSVEGLDL